MLLGPESRGDASSYREGSPAPVLSEGQMGVAERKP